MMKKLILSGIFTLLIMPFAQMSAKNIFVVEGPEKSYNQIRVVNETSQENFNCRIVILNEDDSTRQTYGVFNLKEHGDTDFNTQRFKAGTKFAIQMPKDFPVEVSFTIEYKDYPLFDAVIVYLMDASSGFED